MGSIRNKTFEFIVEVEKECEGHSDHYKRTLITAAAVDIITECARAYNSLFEYPKYSNQISRKDLFDFLDSVMGIVETVDMGIIDCLSINKDLIKEYPHRTNDLGAPVGPPRPLPGRKGTNE